MPSSGRSAIRHSGRESPPAEPLAWEPPDSERNEPHRPSRRRPVPEDPSVRMIGQSPSAKRDRQRAIREIVARASIGNQDELVSQLRARGFAVTQATVSRDIAELGLAKV